MNYVCSMLCKNVCMLFKKLKIYKIIIIKILRNIICINKKNVDFSIKNYVKKYSEKVNRY